MKNLKIALLNNLRKHLTDPAGRGTNITDTFSGNGVLKVFTLTKSPLMYINTVAVDTINKKLNRDYFLNFGGGATKGTITFVDAPALGTNNVVITYKYGDNWIYPGTPQTDDRKLPRIGILRVGGGNRSAGVGERQIFQEPSFRLGVWARSGDAYTISGESYTGDKLLDFIETDIEEKIVMMERDLAEPYNNITMDITNVVDIPFDQDFKLNRREISISGMWKKTIN